MRYNHSSRSLKSIKWLKIAAWVVGASFLLFIGLFIFTVWLETKVERMVAQQSKGVYSLQLFGLKTSPFLGNLSVDSLSLEPDYDRWQALNRQGQEVPRTLLTLWSGPVSLRDLSYWKALVNQSVQLKELEITAPKLLMSAMRKDTTRTHAPLHETAKGFLNGLKIEKLIVRQASLYYREGASSDTLFSLRGYSLTGHDFRLDSSSFRALDRAYYARHYTLKAAQASYFLPEKHQRLTSDSLFVNTESGHMRVDGVKLQPLLEPAALARARGKAVTHQEVELKQATFRGVDFGRHSRGSGVWVKHVTLETPKLVAFKDKQRFEDKGKKPLPHDIVQQIKAPFLIDSLEIRSGYIHYAELVPEAQERGHITFHKLNALISNLSNMPDKMSLENPAIIQASTMVMDRAKLEVAIRLPLLQENGYHTIEGEIGDTNLQLLNPILIPSGSVRIEGGQVRSGRFKMELNQHQANGNLHLLYDDLKIDLLSKGSGGDQSLGKKVLSKATNAIVIKDSNPAEGENPRMGSITVTRDPHKSVFTYWKDCLLSGFLSVMGAEAMAKK